MERVQNFLCRRMSEFRRFFEKFHCFSEVLTAANSFCIDCTKIKAGIGRTGLFRLCEH